MSASFDIITSTRSSTGYNFAFEIPYAASTSLIVTGGVRREVKALVDRTFKSGTPEFPIYGFRLGFLGDIFPDIKFGLFFEMPFKVLVEPSSVMMYSGGFTAKKPLNTLVVRVKGEWTDLLPTVSSNIYGPGPTVNGDFEPKLPEAKASLSVKALVGFEPSIFGYRFSKKFSVFVKVPVGVRATAKVQVPPFNPSFDPDTLPKEIGACEEEHDIEAKVSVGFESSELGYYINLDPPAGQHRQTRHSKQVHQLDSAVLSRHSPVLSRSSG